MIRVEQNTRILNGLAQARLQCPTLDESVTDLTIRSKLSSVKVKTKARGSEF